jgi:putative lipoprotein
MPTAELRRGGTEDRRGEPLAGLCRSRNPHRLSRSIIERKTRFIAARLAFVSLAFAMAACTGPTPKPKSVKPLVNLSGTVTYYEPFTLSPDVTLTVELADVSRQDVPAKVLAEQIISNPGRSPIPFELSYDPDAIVPNHSYAVQARIEWEGKLRFINDTRHCAITRGCPKTVNVVVVPVRR